MFRADPFAAIGASLRAFVADQALANRACFYMALSLANEFVAYRASSHAVVTRDVIVVSLTGPRVRWTNLFLANATFLRASDADYLFADAAGHNLGVGRPLPARGANSPTHVAYLLAGDPRSVQMTLAD